MTCNNDMALLLTSGFQAQSTNRAQVSLEQPQGLVLKNGGAGVLVGRVVPVKTTNMKDESRDRPAIGCPVSLRETLNTSSSMD